MEEEYEEEVYMPDTSILGWIKDESYDAMKDKDELHEPFQRSWGEED